MDYFKIGDEKIKKGAGKDLKTWQRILDKYSAQKKGHKETARFLAKEHKLNGWWSQFITIRYEKEKGYWKISGK